tara:strand:- start:1326 stop:2288 length:963 start_codon:yes stop_codon:yes gene_type:complete
MALTKVDPSVVDDQVIGRKNIIINGDMKVYQRAQSVTGFTAAYKYYTADRMRFSSSGGTVGTWNQEVQTDQNIGDYSNVNVLKTTLATAGQADYYRGVNYRVEPTDIKHMVGKTCTLSFYAKADATTTQQRNIDAISSASVASSVSLGNITLTTSWTRYEASFTMPNCTDYLDITLRVDGDIETSSYITLIQLELGSQATPFEFRSYGEELALCERYYQKIGNDEGTSTHLMVGSAEGTGTYVVSRALRTRMRAVPTYAHLGDVRGYTASAGIVTVSSVTTRCTSDIACVSAAVSGTATVGQAAVLFDYSGGIVELAAEL